MGAVVFASWTPAGAVEGGVTALFVVCCIAILLIAANAHRHHPEVPNAPRELESAFTVKHQRITSLIEDSRTQTQLTGLREMADLAWESLPDPLVPTRGSLRAVQRCLDSLAGYVCEVSLAAGAGGEGAGAAAASGKAASAGSGAAGAKGTVFGTGGAGPGGAASSGVDSTSGGTEGNAATAPSTVTGLVGAVTPDVGVVAAGAVSAVSNGTTQQAVTNDEVLPVNPMVQESLNILLSLVADLDALEWPTIEEGKPAPLTINLSGAKLAGCSLTGCAPGADLTRRARAVPVVRLKLTRADLRGVNCTGVALVGVECDHANADGAILRGADLPRADFGFSTLRGADLGNANLKRTVLRAVNLAGANLDGTDLRHAGLQDAVLQGASLTCANLGEANLASANLRSAALQDSNFQNANLQGAKLHDANLTGTTMRFVNLQQAVLTSANLAGTNLEAVKAEGAKFSNANLVGANAPGADFRRADFSNANVQRCNLGDADLAKAAFTSATLRGASFQNADLREAHFGDTDLRYCNLKQADCRGATFDGSRLLAVDPAIIQTGDGDDSVLLFAQLGAERLCATPIRAVVGENLNDTAEVTRHARLWATGEDDVTPGEVDRLVAMLSHVAAADPPVPETTICCLISPCLSRSIMNSDTLDSVPHHAYLNRSAVEVRT